jgi:hypothetical protein
MKKIFFNTVLLIAFLLMNYSSFSQRWEKYFGVSSRNEFLCGITRYYDKGIYIIGGAAGDGNNGWNIKTDANGNLLWDKILKHTDYTLLGKAAAYDDEGNMYISGTIWVNGSWPFIAKFNACGEKEWCRVLTFGAFLYGFAIDVLVNEKNEVIVLMELESEQQIDEIFLSGFDKNGKMLWINSYASKKNHPLIDHRAGYTVTEHNKEYIISGYCYYPYPNNPNHVYLRPLFIGVDSLYNEKWILPFYALDSVFGESYATVPLNDSIYMGVGIRKFQNLVDYSLLMFFNKNGKEISFSQIRNEQIGPGINSNEIRDIERINDTLFLGGGFFGPDLSENPSGEFIIDTSARLFKFQSRPNLTHIPKIIKTLDKKFVIANDIRQPNSTWYNIYLYKIDENLESVPFDTNQYVYDSLCGGQIQSGEISMNDCVIITGIEDQPTPEQYYASLKTIPIKVFPNPANDKVNFELENTSLHQNIRLRCYDLLGKIMYNESVIQGQRGAAIDISSWPPGMYVAIVYNNGGVVGKSKFVVNQ